MGTTSEVTGKPCRQLGVVMCTFAMINVLVESRYSVPPPEISKSMALSSSTDFIGWISIQAPLIIDG